MYSRWPQVGEPCLHPPPVRKSQDSGVAQAFTGGAVAVPTTSTAPVTTSATATRPAASLQILFPLSLICAFSSQISGSLVVKLRDTRSRGRDYDVGNAGNNDMQSIHYSG